MNTILNKLTSAAHAHRGAINSWASKVAAVVLLGAAHGAQAASGWMTAITNTKDLAQAGATAVVAVGALLGLLAYLYGGKLLWDKGQSERGDDIKGSRILWIFVGGSVCLALAYFGVLTLETLGGSASDVGREI